MRKLLSILTAIVICSAVYGQGVVTKIAQNIESGQPTLFWYKLGKEHPQIKAMKTAIKKKKPAMRIVAQGLGDMSSIRTSARNAAIYSSRYNYIINLIEDITQISTYDEKVEFFIINDDEANASMFPEGTCTINTGLIDDAKNVEEVIAVVAHEIAHYILWHTINDFWRTAKTVKRNQNWAEAGTALAIGAYGASQIYSAQNGVQQSQQAQQQMYTNLTSAGTRIREELGIRTNIFTRLRYMRETEEEADETAFWFLEKNGIDPIYLISFFKRLDVKTPSSLKKAKKTKYSSHPDMAKRIQNIEKLYSKYHNPNFKPNKTLEKYK